MMKKHEIIVTDDKAPSDLALEQEVFKKIDANLKAIGVTKEKDLTEKAANCDAILAKNNPPVTNKVLSLLEKCQIIARAGMGVDSIDVSAAEKNNTFVTNVTSYCEDEVSDHAITLILTCLRKVARLNREVKGGEWDRESIKPAHRLNRMTLGLVGFGKIAQKLAKKANQFGFNLVGCDPYVSQDEFSDSGAEKTSMEKLLDKSDVVSIHVPLTSETNHLFGSREFKKMKTSAYIVNTSRGEIIDQTALTYALEKEWIAGAGLDVLEEEPPQDSSLLRLDNVVITPHVAWYSEEAEEESRQKAAREVKRVLTGEKPLNPINR